MFPVGTCKTPYPSIVTLVYGGNPDFNTDFMFPFFFILILEALESLGLPSLTYPPPRSNKVGAYI